MNTAQMGIPERFIFTLDGDIKSALKRFASKQGRSAAAQAEQILATYLMGVGELSEMPIREERRGGDRKSKAKQTEVSTDDGLN
jgi:plasmid stability protein